MDSSNKKTCYMGRLIERQQILEVFGLNKHQQDERSALTLLALCNLKHFNGDRFLGPR